jgi:hypothetical protein
MSHSGLGTREEVASNRLLALRLMKMIDTIYLGPSAKYQWREMHRRRYKLMYPAKVGYMLMHYIRLSPDDQAKIIQEKTEDQSGA